jgi:hypothetical protein
MPFGPRGARRLLGFGFPPTASPTQRLPPTPTEALPARGTVQPLGSEPSIAVGHTRCFAKSERASRVGADDQVGRGGEARCCRPALPLHAEGRRLPIVRADARSSQSGRRSMPLETFAPRARVGQARVGGRPRGSESPGARALAKHTRGPLAKPRARPRRQPARAHRPGGLARAGGKTGDAEAETPGIPQGGRPPRRWSPTTPSGTCSTVSPAPARLPGEKWDESQGDVRAVAHGLESAGVGVVAAVDLKVAGEPGELVVAGRGSGRASG